MNPTHRCGTVALIGRPNVGKSTLLNRFLGQKIAIVSPKPETTRDRLLGILTLADAQILFLDTPGIYRGAKTLMAKHQVGQAREALEAADVLLLMTEAHVGVTDGDREILQLLPKFRPSHHSRESGNPDSRPPEDDKKSASVFLAINKVDRIERKLVLPQIEAFSRLYPFREIFPICARKGPTAQPLLEALKKALPEGLALYPADQVTDRPVRELAGELIREKTLIFTHEEIPHAVAVMIEEWRSGQPSSRRPNPPVIPALDRDRGQAPAGIEMEDDPRFRGGDIGRSGPQTIYIRATIYLERESQKGILIGKEGGLLKRIGQTARLEIEKLVEGPVFLDLWVKVAPNWRKNPRDLKRFGYG